MPLYMYDINAWEIVPLMPSQDLKKPRNTPELDQMIQLAGRHGPLRDYDPPSPAAEKCSNIIFA